MELKHKYFHKSSSWFYRYNWTLLELKQHFAALLQEAGAVIIEPYWNWNYASSRFEPLYDGYNWTLLELKPRNRINHLQSSVVIIEPYWNWNVLIFAKLFSLRSYNWTLLELKLMYFFSSFLSMSCYNWTLLELKQLNLSQDRYFKPVIIEPYWNWNRYELTPSARPWRYNWTLLELKQRTSLMKM